MLAICAALRPLASLTSTSFTNGTITLTNCAWPQQVRAALSTGQNHECGIDLLFKRGVAERVIDGKPGRVGRGRRTFALKLAT
eukprot:648199-Rhodomonas_salina.3